MFCNIAQIVKKDHLGLVKLGKEPQFESIIVYFTLSTMYICILKL